MFWTVLKFKRKKSIPWHVLSNISPCTLTRKHVPIRFEWDRFSNFLSMMLMWTRDSQNFPHSEKCRFSRCLYWIYQWFETPKVAATYRPEVGKVWDHSSTLEKFCCSPYPSDPSVLGALSFPGSTWFQGTFAGPAGTPHKWRDSASTWPSKSIATCAWPSVWPIGPMAVGQNPPWWGPE